MFDWLGDLFSGNSSVSPSVDVAPADWSVPDINSYLSGDFSFSGDSDPAWAGQMLWDSVPAQQYADAYQQGGGDGYTYLTNDFVGPQQDAGGQGDLMALLQSAGKFLQSPGGQLAGGLGMAGVSAWDASRRNAMMKKGMKKQQQELAARKAEQQKYSAPVAYQLMRSSQAPAQRRGEAEWFSDNRLAPPHYAEGGGVSDEDYERMVADARQATLDARQATLDARMDRPSALGFLKYVAAGKKMPSEIAAAKRGVVTKPDNVVDVIRARQRDIDEAAKYADGGSACACGGLSRYVKGGTAGQSDKVPAMLSDGEYVMDADVVSALGDGNNAAGASALDKMRENVRAHKRGAPTNKIPPKAKKPEAYLKKGAK